MRVSWLLLHVSSFLGYVEAHNEMCKSTPNDASWPSLCQWNHLNESLSGRLIHPSPPALACHPSYPGFNNDTCTNITSSWSTFAFHQDNPISTAWNNINNDSCLPNASAPCSGLGYPVYVVNATSAKDVKLAIDFARENNVRLNVKASGHDYIKRSAAPYSLSIWTRYMVGGYEYHDHFKPKNCNITIDTTAVTAGAASYVSDVYYNLHQHNLTVVDGMGPEVTMGGYLTGGGHSPISNIFGLGSDQVYEVEMVTPTGKITIANECQNTDLFWAVRGGGGSTFGVLTKVTVRTVPSSPIAVYDFTIEAQINSRAYWDSVAYLLAQYPTLSDSNVAAYTYMYPNTSAAGLGGDIASFEAVFALYDPASANILENLLKPFLHHVNETYSGQITTKATSTIFPNFYSMFLKYADDGGAGVDKVVGSRLLPPETLTKDAFRGALMDFMGDAGGRLYMVSGKGVWDAKPRGGSDAVNPAWRKALIHAVASQDWTPFDETERATVEHNINNVQVEALRRLVPESGAYLNEAYWNEPNFQQAFWGSNYERLQKIKKAVDPDDVFWCHVCVGSEEWKEVRHRLCRVR
ncbi:uncharacterized protein TRUGW13939_05419 [Talaromyces rugulosus]|uniref:FAD-binding PCMH-type domain-containing protein n=1 Tax=Talaromyces rugulosus TaxID=121627 RepID=A0A7H8QWJ9_TALRU|nr:uncharacterized protein TRUGW13939_05419 [Talaromyces rugulosus]QKX58297.1 hypothetical protein TRUGW13939_05419 [Talaromyces rugulosus]